MIGPHSTTSLEYEHARTYYARELRAEDGGPPIIDIKITNHSDEIYFYVSNTVSDEVAQRDRAPIGLLNIRKQLDLIYGDRYQLDILEKDNRFEVTLIIIKYTTIFTTNPIKVIKESI